MNPSERLAKITTSFDLLACDRAKEEHPSAEKILNILIRRIQESRYLLGLIELRKANEWEADVALQDISILREALILKLNGCSGKIFEAKPKKD